MRDAELSRWRSAERARLVAARQQLPRSVLAAFHRSMDSILEHSFPELARGVLAFCWPIRNEYDARHLARRLRARGALTALPVVVAPRSPLVFREWHPGVALAEGPLGIPYPAASQELVPDHLLLPMNGWDAGGYRLGYGGGYFDRTLASLAPRPTVIGVALEQARLATLHPQPWDVPMDFVVTERGRYRRTPQGLVCDAVPGDQARNSR